MLCVCYGRDAKRRSLGAGTQTLFGDSGTRDLLLILLDLTKILEAPIEEVSTP